MRENIGIRNKYIYVCLVFYFEPLIFLDHENSSIYLLKIK